jgi:hypothetical protein
MRRKNFFDEDQMRWRKTFSESEIENEIKNNPQTKESKDWFDVVT